MENVKLYINEAAVTAVHEFNSYKGYGVDFFIAARSNYSTLYLQVVLYDNEARRYSNIIHKGDNIMVEGSLKVKPYSKSDDTAGYSLVIEKPVVFRKANSSTSDQQSQQIPNERDGTSHESITQITSAESASAVTAEDDCIDDSDFWDAVDENYKQEREKASNQSIVDDPEPELPF